jgi:hypothetical protein
MFLSIKQQAGSDQITIHFISNFRITNYMQAETTVQCENMTEFLTALPYILANDEMIKIENGSSKYEMIITGRYDAVPESASFVDDAVNGNSMFDVIYHAVGDGRNIYIKF